MPNETTYIPLEDLAAIIRAERRRREMTMQALGEDLGFTRQWIHDAEKADRVTPKLTALRVKIFHKLFPGEILSGPVLIRTREVSEAPLFAQGEGRSKAA